MTTSWCGVLRFGGGLDPGALSPCAARARAGLPYQVRGRPPGSAAGEEPFCPWVLSDLSSETRCAEVTLRACSMPRGCKGSAPRMDPSGGSPGSVCNQVHHFGCSSDGSAWSRSCSCLCVPISGGSAIKAVTTQTVVATRLTMWGPHSARRTAHVERGSAKHKGCFPLGDCSGSAHGPHVPGEAGATLPAGPDLHFFSSLVVFCFVRGF